jgi:hypothetical protein
LVGEEVNLEPGDESGDVDISNLYDSIGNAGTPSPAPNAVAKPSFIDIRSPIPQLLNTFSWMKPSRTRDSPSSKLSPVPPKLLLFWFVCTVLWAWCWLKVHNRESGIMQ